MRFLKAELFRYVFSVTRIDYIQLGHGYRDQFRGVYIEFVVVDVPLQRPGQIYQLPYQYVGGPSALSLDEDDQLVPYQEAEIVVDVIGEHTFQRHCPEITYRSRRIIRMQGTVRFKLVFGILEDVPEKAVLEISFYIHNYTTYVLKM